jgi:hypothetical protein
MKKEPDWIQIRKVFEALEMLKSPLFSGAKKPEPQEPPKPKAPGKILYTLIPDKRAIYNL